jgi:hypothetical protein
LGAVTLLDLDANLNRSRQRPHSACVETTKQKEYAVETIHKNYENLCLFSDNSLPIKEDE